MRMRLAFFAFAGLGPWGLGACRAQEPAAGATHASLLDPRFASFEDCKPADFPWGSAVNNNLRTPGFWAANGRMSEARASLSFPATAAKDGRVGANITLKDPQGNIGNLFLRLPLATPLELPAGQDRTVLVRFWARGDHRLEDGAITYVRCGLYGDAPGGVASPSGKNPVKVEAVRIPGAPRFVTENASYFPQWTLFGATYKVSASAPACLYSVFFLLGKKVSSGDALQPLSLQLDDVSLIDITNSSDAQIGALMRGVNEQSSEERKQALVEQAAGADTTPDITTNRLSNASFETDTDYDWIQTGGGPVNRTAYVSGQGYHAARALSFSKLITLDGRSGGSIESPAIPVRPFRKMAFSVWAKKENAEQDARLQLSVINHVQQTFTGVGADWRRFEIPFSVGSRILGGVGLRISGQNILIDAVQLEEGRAARDFHDSQDISVALVNDENGNVQFLDQPFTVQLQAAPSNIAKGTLRGRLVVTDVAGKTTAETAVSLDVPAGRLSTKSIQLDAKAQGIFNITFVPADNTTTEWRGCPETVIARVPRPLDLSPRESIIGDTPYFNDFNLSLLERLGVKWVRTIPSVVSAFTWQKIETEPGKWDWSFPNSVLKKLDGHKMGVLGLLWGAPDFAARPNSHSNNHGGNLPGDMARWQDFVRRSVTRYSDRVDAWEVWNEPYDTWYQDVQKYAYAGVKAADPKAYALGWSMPASTGAAARYGGNTPGDELTLDGFDIHQYGPPYLRFNDYLLRGVGSMAGKIGIWNTEVGSPQAESMYRRTGRDDPDDRLKQAADLSQLVLMHKAVDAKFIYYSSRFPHGASGLSGYSVGVIEASGVPSTGAVARAVAAHMVDGSKPAGYQTAELNSGMGLWGGIFDKGDSIVLALFLTRLEQAQDFKLPKGVAELSVPPEWATAQTFDLMGMPLGKAGARVTVGYSPVFLQLKSGDAKSAFAALKKMVAPTIKVAEPQVKTDAVLAVH